MPVRLKDLARVLGEYGATVEEGGGRHNFRVTKPGLRPYPIPAHNGWRTEVGNDYINGVARHLGVDKKAIWKKLRGC